VSLKQYLLVPALIAAIGVIYWFLSYEVAGTALLIIFALAMGLFGWVLVPTANNIGPVAPVDPDWHERER
jgi:hypothetical protein